MFGLTQNDWENFREAAHEMLDDVVSAKVLGGLGADAREELLSDLTLIRRAVLASEEPHIVVVGKRDIELSDILQGLLNNGRELGTLPETTHGHWAPYDFANGRIHILDLRRDEDEELNTKPIGLAIPDVVIGVVKSREEDVELVVEDLIRAVYQAEDNYDFTPASAIAIHRDSPSREVGDFLTQQAVKGTFHEWGFERHWTDVVQLNRPGALVRTLLPEMPQESRLVLARVSADPQAKREISDALIRVCSSVNATIASVPLPIAGTVPITSVQLVMIAGIAYVSGRELNSRTITEFLTAMGINVASGLALRELARTLVQLVPFAGPFVSAAIAGKATQAIGRSAQKYYI